MGALGTAGAAAAAWGAVARSSDAAGLDADVSREASRAGVFGEVSGCRFAFVFISFVSPLCVFFKKDSRKWYHSMIAPR